MQNIEQFENEIVEIEIAELLDEERRIEPISACAAATACAEVTHRW